MEEAVPGQEDSGGDAEAERTMGFWFMPEQRPSCSLCGSFLDEFGHPAHEKPAGFVDGPPVGAVFQPFQEISESIFGNMVVLHQEHEEGGKYLGRSLAVRVCDVTEMIRVLEVFFKL